MANSPRISRQIDELQKLDRVWRKYLRATRHLQRELAARPADACSLHDLSTIRACFANQLVEELNLGTATAKRLRILAKELQDVGRNSQRDDSAGD